MSDQTPYVVDVLVPDAVLLAKADPQNAPQSVGIDPSDSLAIWFRAEATSLRCDAAGVVQAWQARNHPNCTAYPTKANDNALRLDPKGGLLFQPRVHAGLVVEGLLPAPSDFACAVRYRSPIGEARTLLTINPREAGTYLFLTEKEGQIYWQDQGNTAIVSVPAPTGGGWVAAGLAENMLFLAVAPFGTAFSHMEQSDIVTADLLAAFAGENDIFIGCRSHRSGILKTLGQSHIDDVLMWTKGLAGITGPDTLTAICQFCDQDPMPS